jgi:hypothetical protein
VTPILEVTDSPHALFQLTAFHHLFPVPALLLLSATHGAGVARHLRKTADLPAALSLLRLIFARRGRRTRQCGRQVRLGLPSDPQTPPRSLEVAVQFWGERWNLLNG